MPKISWMTSSPGPVPASGTAVSPVKLLPGRAGPPPGAGIVSVRVVVMITSCGHCRRPGGRRLGRVVAGTMPAQVAGRIVAP
jgi:hypothetical protein